MDNDDAERLGIVDVAKLPLLSVKEDRPFIAAMRINTRQHLHQGRFARPVLANKGVNLARHDREIDIAQRFDDTERLTDIAHFQKRRTSNFRLTVRLLAQDRIGYIHRSLPLQFLQPLPTNKDNAVNC